MALDSKVGFVLQSKGRGEARVFMANTLSRIPTVGEMIKVSFKGSKGIVADVAEVIKYLHFLLNRCKVLIVC